MLPRGAMDAPFPEALEAGLDGALSALMQRVAVLSVAGSWTGMVLRSLQTSAILKLYEISVTGSRAGQVLGSARRKAEGSEAVYIPRDFRAQLGIK